MAARVEAWTGPGREGAAVRLLSPVVVALTSDEEEALVESLALALLPLFANGAGVGSGSEVAEGLEAEGGERGAGCDL